MEIKAELFKPYAEEQRTKFIVEQNHNKGYEIRETEESLQAWGYTEEEIEKQEKERIANLTMTALDLINCLQNEGLTLEQINAFLESNLALKMQLTYCQNVYCKVVCDLTPLTIDGIEITKEMVINWFLNKERGQ